MREGWHYPDRRRDGCVTQRVERLEPELGQHGGLLIRARSDVTVGEGVEVVLHVLGPLDVWSPRWSVPP